MSDRLEVRMTPALKVQVHRLADALGLSVSALVIRLLQAAVRRGASLQDWEVHTVAIERGAIVAVDPPDHELGPPTAPVVAPRAFWALVSGGKR